MKKELIKQIELLKKYMVSNYTVENDKITINGSLYLSSLTSADKDFLNRNVKKLKDGYNEKLGYCFFDGILSKVLSIHKRNEFTLYKTPFEFIAQNGKYTAHGKTIKKAIEDCNFKIVAEKLKNEPILKDTVININHYRLITGSCELGVEQWMDSNFDEKEKELVFKKGIRADKLLPILKKTNAYGFEKFNSLINF